MWAEVRAELGQNLLSCGLWEIVPTEFDQKFERFLKILWIYLHVHASEVAGHVLVNVVQQPPVQHQVFWSKQTSLFQEAEQDPGKHLHEPWLHLGRGKKLPGKLDEMNMVFLGELEPIQVNIGGKPGHPGYHSRPQLSEQHSLRQVQLDLLQPGGAVVVHLPSIGQVVVVQQLLLIISSIIWQPWDDMHVHTQIGGAVLSSGLKVKKINIFSLL